MTVGDFAGPSLQCPANAVAEATSPAGALVTYGSALASDPVSPPTVTYSQASGTQFPLGPTTVTVTATDTAGLSATCSFSVTVHDTTPPAINCPANVTAQATSASGATVDFPAATATDAVSTPVVTYSIDPLTTFPVGSTTVTATATDAASNASACSFTVTVADLTGPMITCPANVMAEATSASGAVVTYDPATASDPIAPPVITYSQNSGASFPLGSTVVTARATNVAQLQSTCTFSVTVRDTTPPTILCPGNVTAQATSAGGANVSYSPALATDAVSFPTVTYSQQTGTLFALGTTTVVATATDAADNSATCSFTVTVSDLTGPALQCPANTIAEATSSAGAIVNYPGAVASDPLGPPVVTYSEPTGSLFALGTTDVTVTATNAVNLTSTCTFQILVHDTTQPQVTCPGDLTVQATSGQGAIVSYDPAMASDAVSTPVIAYSQDSGTEFAFGTTTVTATATDAAGNAGTCSFSVTVGDLSGPAIACPSDVAAEATSAAGAIVTYSPATASDPIGAPAISYTQNSGTTFRMGVTVVTATATDTSGSQSTCTFRITVRDTTAPALSCPASSSVQATSPIGALVAYQPASASDAVTPVPTVTYSQVSGTIFPLGVATVLVTASDAAGNSSTCAFNITVTDLAPPTITCPADITAEATSPQGADVTFTSATTSDPAGPPTMSSTAESGALFPIGDTPVTFTATNIAGLQATCTFKITVRDTTPPVVTCPGNLAIQATSPGGAVVMYAPATATDAASTPTMTYSQASGSEFSVGDTTVTATATDASGNASSCSFHVTVGDLTGPGITCPSDFVAEATSSHGADVVFPSATASDPVAQPVITYSPPPGSTFPLGTSQVMATATNAGGFTATCTFNVTVRDTTPPDVSCPANITEQATSSAGAVVDYPQVTASDAVSTATVSYSLPEGAEFPVGTTTVTATATDAAGNSSSCTFTVTCGDFAPPALTCPADLVVEATSPDGASVMYPSIDASDPLAPPVIGFAPLDDEPFPIGTTAVTVTATNVAGLSSTCQFNVVVQVTEPPVLTCPANVTIQATSASGALATYADAMATDPVSTPQVTYSKASGSLFALGSTPVVVTAADAWGNSATCTFDVTVADQAPPTIQCPSPGPTEATSSRGAVVTYPPATATDPVATPVIAYTQAPGSTFALGTTTVVATATNAGGVMATCSFTVVVQDTTAPALTCPMNVVAPATGSDGATVTYPDAVATDAVTATPIITYSAPSGSTFPVGTTMVNVTAADAAGNQSTCSFTVTVFAPLSCPADITAEATSADGATVTFAATAGPDGGVSPALTYSPESGSTFPLGNTTVTVTAHYGEGITGSCTFKVTVRDTTPPVFTCPASETLDQTSSGGATVFFTVPTPTDAVTATPVVTADHLSGVEYPVGTTTVTVTASDQAGNSSTCTFNITVTAESQSAPSCSCSGASTPTMLWLLGIGILARRMRRVPRERRAGLATP